MRGRPLLTPRNGVCLPRASRPTARTTWRAPERLRSRSSPAWAPGSRARVELALLDSLRATGLTSEDLRARFVLLLGEEVQEYSIVQHEGRHAIDHGKRLERHCVIICWGKLILLSSSDLEFDAKLSQVAFAPRPELAIESIMGPNLGDSSPHGIANARIMRGILDGMTAHQSEIAHLDRSAPLLPQLPLLTSAQLRAAFKSLDPLAR